MKKAYQTMVGGETKNYLSSSQASELKDVAAPIHIVNVPDFEIEPDGLEWERGRQADYLTPEEYLDMIYWDMVNGTTTFVDHRSGVKAANPKPV